MLKQKFIEKNKKVTELENIDFQMDMLANIQGMDELKTMLDEYKIGGFEELSKEAIDYSKDLMEGYAKGDVVTMENAIKKQKESEKTYNILIKDRNVNMVKKIDEYIKEDKTYIVAVGALHFFGDDGIVKLLKDKGYEVKKIS